MPAPAQCFDVEIDANEGAAALDLERRVSHLAPTTIGHGGRWIVEIPAAESPDEIEAVVGQWLDEIGEESTTMRIDGREHRVGAHHRRLRTTNADFIG